MFRQPQYTPARPRDYGSLLSTWSLFRFRNKTQILDSSVKNWVMFPRMGTILLVEDNPTLLTLFREVLKRAGYEVLEAASAREALERAGRFSGEIHAVVTDFSLAETSGLSLVHQLRKSRPSLPAVVMSGYWIYPAPPDITVLHKPCLPRELLDAVKKAA